MLYKLISKELCGSDKKYYDYLLATEKKRKKSRLDNFHGQEKKTDSTGGEVLSGDGRSEGKGGCGYWIKKGCWMMCGGEDSGRMADGGWKTSAVMEGKKRYAMHERKEGKKEGKVWKEEVVWGRKIIILL